MPKMKTNKATSSRFKVRKSGSIKRGQQGTGHLFTGKRRKTKRKLRKNVEVHATQAKTVKKMIQG